MVKKDYISLLPIHPPPSVIQQMRWKNMKMERISLEVKYKWYEGLENESWEGPRVSKYLE